jgi:hypothetical protein
MSKREKSSLKKPKRQLKIFLVIEEETSRSTSIMNKTCAHHAWLARMMKVAPRSGVSLQPDYGRSNWIDIQVICTGFL